MLLDVRRPADAERELRGVLAQSPQHVGALVLLAIALVHQGRADEAVATAREAVGLAPDKWYPHYNAGIVYFEARRHAEALAAVHAALALAPNEARLWELLTRVHIRTEQWREAPDPANPGLALEPENATLVALLSLTLTVLGQGPPALAAAEHALRLAPESSLAHLVYGRAALSFGDPGDAARAFREVLRLSPGFDQGADLLMEALKRRNPLYRVMRRVRARLPGARIALLLPIVPPIILFVFLVVLLHWAAWTAEAFATLRLAREKTARLLLPGREARAAALCCCLLVAGAALIALGVATANDAVGVAGGATMALVTPVQEAAYTGSPRARVVLATWAALLGAAIVASVILPSAPVALAALYTALLTVWAAAGARRLPRR
jgi:tetratricopeptide (TPR) repeat protein